MQQMPTLGHPESQSLVKSKISNSIDQDSMPSVHIHFEERVCFHICIECPVPFNIQLCKDPASPEYDGFTKKLFLEVSYSFTVSTVLIAAILELYSSGQKIKKKPSSKSTAVR